jgi:hypothetical protein
LGGSGFVKPPGRLAAVSVRNKGTNGRATPGKPSKAVGVFNTPLLAGCSPRFISEPPALHHITAYFISSSHRTVLNPKLECKTQTESLGLGRCSMHFIVDTSRSWWCKHYYSLKANVASLSAHVKSQICVSTAVKLFVSRRRCLPDWQWQ